MMVRIRNKEINNHDTKLRDQFYTGLIEEDYKNKNIFYFAK